MRNKDEQLGKPEVIYKGTEAEIEALVPSEAMFAYATDTGMIGWHDGSAWVWGPMAKNVRMNTINSPTFKSLERWFDHFQSSGYYAGGDFTSNGDGTVAVSGGDGIIKALNEDDATNYFFYWDADPSVTLVDNSTNYIYVKYDADSPTIESSTTPPEDTRTNILLGQIFREGNSLHLLKGGMVASELGKNVLERFTQQYGEVTRTSGGIVSETGTLNIAITNAVLWAGLKRLTTTGYDTSVSGNFEYYYYNGTAWVESDQTAIDSANYNNVATGLTPVGVARYGVHWVYCSADGELLVVYGQDSYRLDQAQAAQPPASLPRHIADFAWLAAKIIVAKDATVFTEIESAYDTKFTSQTAAIHNDLGSLQGGTAGEYYHLTSAQAAQVAAGIATAADVIAGTDNTKMVTPLALESAGVPKLALIGGVPHRSIWIPTFEPTLTGGCAPKAQLELGTNKNVYDYWAFDKDVIEHAYYNLAMPSDYAGGSLYAKVYWAHPAATINFKVRWAVFIGLAGVDAGGLDKAFTGVAINDTGGAANTLYITPLSSAITLTGNQAEALNNLEARRYGDNATYDTLDADAYLIGVMLYYPVL